MNAPITHSDPRMQRWLDYAAGSHSSDKLRAMLAETATFHSPVVHTPQEGREKTFAYLHAADHVFSDSAFEYVRTIVDGDNGMLEFTAEIDGIHVNGVDIIHWDAHGQIDDFKVMVRPMQAMNKLWQMMAAQLEAAAS